MSKDIDLDQKPWATLSLGCVAAVAAVPLWRLNVWLAVVVAAVGLGLLVVGASLPQQPTEDSGVSLASLGPVVVGATVGVGLAAFGFFYAPLVGLSVGMVSLARIESFRRA